MSVLATIADRPAPEALVAAGAGWRHALAHGDRAGLLALYRRALACRIRLGDDNLDAEGALRLADSLVVARLARMQVLPAGWWPAALRGHRASLLDSGWDEMRLVWPVLEIGTADVPFAEDLLVLDRRDHAAWGLVAGSAGALQAEPDPFHRAVHLDLALAGERPLRLHRRPWDWLAAVTRQQEAVPSPDGLADAAARTEHLCLLDPRGSLAERVLSDATRLLCDDLDHAELVKRQQRALLAAQHRPEILVPAPAAPEEGATA